MHACGQAKEASFSEKKWILWARPSAGINHACSVEATGEASYFTEEADMCFV